MSKTIKFILVLTTVALILCVLLAGCSMLTDVWESIGGTNEAVGPTITAATTAINPIWGGIVGLISGIIATAFTTYKTMKPKIVSAERRSDRIRLTLSGVVEAVELYKTDYPSRWKALKAALNEQLNIFDDKLIDEIKDEI